MIRDYLWQPKKMKGTWKSSFNVSSRSTFQILICQMSLRSFLEKKIINKILKNNNKDIAEPKWKKKKRRDSFIQN